MKAAGTPGFCHSSRNQMRVLWQRPSRHPQLFLQALQEGTLGTLRQPLPSSSRKPQLYSQVTGRALRSRASSRDLNPHSRAASLLEKTASTLVPAQGVLQLQTLTRPSLELSSHHTFRGKPP